MIGDRTYRWAAMVGLAAACSLCVAGCPKTKTPGEPAQNLIIITLDTTRADHLSPYGYDRIDTPTYERIAAEGVLFENALTAVPITLPSHSTMMTGSYPPKHGARNNGGYFLPDRVVTVAEILKKRGFHTGAFISAWVLEKRFGLNQGFDIYQDDLWGEETPPMFMIRERPANRTLRVAVEWLENILQDKQPDTRFFQWVHFFDAHATYNMHSLGGEIYINRPYDGEIHYVDKNVNIFLAQLERLGVDKNTAIIIVGDHGESLGEHHEKTHAILMYRSTLHVPMMMRWPGMLPAGKRVASQVRTVDLAPTMLELLGVAPTKAEAQDFQGASLVPLADGREQEQDRVAYVENVNSREAFGWATLRGLHRGDYSYIHVPKPEVYDTQKDPKETVNLAPERPDLVAELRADYEEYLADISPPSDQPAPARELDPETEESLLALGYAVAPAALEEEDFAKAIDPKDGIQDYHLLERGRGLLRRGSPERAIAFLEEAFEKNKYNASIVRTLGMAHMQVGAFDKAMDYLRAAQAIEPDDKRIRLQMAGVYMRRADHAFQQARAKQLEAGASAPPSPQGGPAPFTDPEAMTLHQEGMQHLETAETMYREVIATAPQLVEASLQLSMLYQRKGDLAGAEKLLLDLLDKNDKHPPALMQLADLYFNQERWEESKTYYSRAIAISPHHPRALLQRGNTYKRLKQFTQARADYEAAIEAQPQAWYPYYNLACLDALENKPDDAFKRLEQAIQRGLTDYTIPRYDEDLLALKKDDKLEKFLKEHPAPEPGERGPQQMANTYPAYLADTAYLPDPYGADAYGDGHEH